MNILQRTLSILSGALVVEGRRKCEIALRYRKEELGEEGVRGVGGGDECGEQEEGSLHGIHCRRIERPFWCSRIQK